LHESSREGIKPCREVKFQLFDTVACPYISMHTGDEVTVGSWKRVDQIAIEAPAITAFGIKAP
jgi:hypothetical protein